MVASTSPFAPAAAWTVFHMHAQEGCGHGKLYGDCGFRPARPDAIPQRSTVSKPLGSFSPPHEKKTEQSDGKPTRASPTLEADTKTDTKPVKIGIVWLSKFKLITSGKWAFLSRNRGENGPIPTLAF